jgi:hypothetical protein
VWYNEIIFSDNYSQLLTSPENAGKLEYFVEKHGILGLMDRLASGLMNLFNILSFFLK